MKRTLVFLSVFVLAFVLGNASALSQSSDSLQEIKAGSISFQILSEYEITSNGTTSVVYKDNKSDPYGKAISVTILDTSNLHLTGDVDLDNNFGHAYQILTNFVTSESNSLGITFTKYGSEMTILDNMPSIVLKATSGTVIWNEVACYHNGVFVNIRFMANTANTSAEAEFDDIVASLMKQE